MTNYIPHYTKKKQILTRKEAELRRLLERGADAEKLIACAEQIIEARVRVLRARRAMLVPKGDPADLFAKIDGKIEATQTSSPAEIIAEFRKRLASRSD